MLEKFIRSNFDEAIKIQSAFEHDLEMVKSAKENTLNNLMVKDWMRGYGLFQGIKNEVREQIANEYINFVKLKQGKDLNLENDFKELHKRLHKVCKRKWLSATSKLLWCMHPNDVVIYDAFVERSIAILQCLDKDLAKLPRVDYPPNIKKSNGQDLITKHYINYQNLVILLYQKYQNLISKLKSESSVNYEFDIRIFDKLLWIMGDLNSPFRIDEVDCKVL
jgi:hypothetical protein